MSMLGAAFWFFWTHLGLGEEYFSLFLPRALEKPPLLDCVGIAAAISVLKVIVFVGISKSRG